MFFMFDIYYLLVFILIYCDVGIMGCSKHKQLYLDTRVRSPEP